MKQVVQNFKSGQLSVEEVPPPALGEGMVLVQNCFSLISTGTEKSTVKVGKAGLLGKARQRPDLVQQVFDNIRKEGLLNTYKKVRTKLDTLKALGYSTAGVVLASLDRDGRFKPGDRVACAGQDYASHAEIVAVPQNLVVKVPDKVSLKQASFTTIGAISMQGLRQCDPKLGESVCVIGLGLLGQITGQLLQANGCRVFGIDLDSRLVELMTKSGTGQALARDHVDLEPVLEQFTRGRGFDSVVITAATSSNDPVELATRICRHKGKMVVVGDVKMDIPRDPHFYRKELELKMSTSYGPGRYDPQFEEKGHDYPFGYVRWTEQRNMEAFMDQLDSGTVDIDPLVSHVFPVEDAQKAYELVVGGSNHESLGILLEYQGEVITDSKPAESVEAASGEKKGVAFIGAGSFAQSYLIPHAKAHDAQLATVVTTRSLTAKGAADKFGFQHATTDSAQVFADDAIGTVFIATRHDSHANLVVDGLKAGKNIFVEKPLALDPEQLDQVEKAHQESSGRLMVGFNRRFSQAAVYVQEHLKPLNQPSVFVYRINADRLDKDHWSLDPDLGGGRIIGEVCHFIDLMQYLADSYPVQVFASSVSNDNRAIKDFDNVTISLRFQDGSIGQIIYTSAGSKSLPKERLEVFSGGRAWIIDDFKKVMTFSSDGKKTISTSGKGHREEVFEFLSAIRDGKPMPISFQSIYATTLTTFRIMDSLSTNLPQSVEVLDN